MDSHLDKVQGMDVQTHDQNNILVAADDPATLETIGSLLQEKGYAVSLAASDGKCLDWARHYSVDLILIDATKSRADGMETGRRLNADPVLRTIPVIFIISDPPGGVPEIAYGSVASDFVLAPVDGSELLARIDRLLKMKPIMGKITEADKLQKVLETAGDVCHSLNQPLQYVLGAVQILLMDMSPEDKLFMSLNTVREKVEQMGAITRKLADVTRYRSLP